MNTPTTQAVHITVNGQAQRAQVQPRTHLVDFLREELGLKGSHLGCEHGVCGACTVRVNGRIVRGCLTLAVQADSAKVDIRTVQGGDFDLSTSAGRMAVLSAAPKASLTGLRMAARTVNAKRRSRPWGSMLRRV